MFEGMKKIRELWKTSRDYYDQQEVIQREKEELEFLPAAVEILETPASPAGRLTAYLIILFFMIALIWAWFGKIDVEAIAEGKIIPKGQVKAVQTLETGRIEAILVSEGEKVIKGQPLVELDPTESEVDVQQVTSDLLDAQLNAFRIELLLDSLEDAATENTLYQQALSEKLSELPEQASSAQLHLQNALLEQDIELYQAMTSSRKANLEKQNAAVAGIQADIGRLKTLFPLFEKQENLIREKLDGGYVSRLDWLNIKERQVETRQSLIVQQKQLEEALAEKRALIDNGHQQDKQFRSERLNQLLEYRDSIRNAELALTKVREREANRYLNAPVTGTVQQLQVHTIGGVVQAAQTLMAIVPDDEVLEVEAFLPNKDIGFVRNGLPAEIKVESFTYTRYGLISGNVRQVSQDSVEQEGTGRVFPVYIELDEHRMLVGEQWQNLQAGMNVTVEMKTGTRRVLEYFLAPFLRYQDEAMTER